MSRDPVMMIARLIFSLNPKELQRLRVILEEGIDGDPAGVGAVIPPKLPLKEGAAEVKFDDWPDEYWESQA
jgi:hypothetical protein